MNSIKVLVLGASGFLGSTIYTNLKNKKDIDVIGTCYRQKHDGLISLNIEKHKEIDTILKSNNFDIVIWSLVDLEREDILTKDGLSYLLGKISNKTRFIYVSTTVASNAKQSENVKPEYRQKGMYLFNYVNGKIDGEKLVSKSSNYSIVRPGSIYGVDGLGRLDGRTKLLNDKWNKKEVFKRATNILTSFVDVQNLADAIIELLLNRYVGIINIAGNLPISHYDFCIRRAKQAGISNRYIIPYESDESREYSLDTTLSKIIISTQINNLR